MEYYSAIKRNEIELFVVRWMDLETVIKSEVSQKEKNTCISQYCEKPLYVAGRNINGAATVGNCIAFSQKLNLELLFHFCIYPKELKADLDTCTPMFIATLFTHNNQKVETTQMSIYR